MNNPRVIQGCRFRNMPSSQNVAIGRWCARQGDAIQWDTQMARVGNAGCSVIEAASPIQCKTMFLLCC